MNQRAMQWVVGNDTGTSSKTIWAVMQGAVTEPGQQTSFNYSVPWDPADFGRCHRLLLIIPEWRVNLSKVAEIFPAWKPLVDNWDELTALYVRDLGKGKSTELYDRMQVLNDEGRILDGWERTGPYSWARKAE